MIGLEMPSTQYMVELRLFRQESKVILKPKVLLLGQVSKQLRVVSSKIFYSQDLTASLSTETLFFMLAFSLDLLSLVGQFQFKN
jgi:hypothetical protein